MDQTILEKNDSIYRRFDRERLDIIVAFHAFKKRALASFGGNQRAEDHIKGVVAYPGMDDLSISIAALHREFILRLVFRKSDADQLQVFLIALERSYLSPEQFREVARTEFNLSGEAIGLGTFEHGDPIKLTDKGQSCAAIIGHMALEALSHDPCGWM